MKNKLIIYFLFLSCTNSFAQQSKIDSLLTLLKKDTEDTNKVNHLNALAWKLSNSNPDTSIILANHALSLSEKVKSKKHIGNSYHYIAWANYLKGNYPSSIENNLKALKLREELNDKSGIAKSLGNIGNVYKEQADYPKALDYYFRALKMAEELGEKKSIADNYVRIGLVYWNQADYPKSLDYYFKGLKRYEELSNKNGIALTLGNIGIVYMEQADYPKALDYYFRRMKLDEESGNKSNMAINLGNIGIVYDSQADYPKAIDYYFRALKMAEELGNKNSVAAILGNIGSLYTETGKFKEAEKYLKHSLALTDSIGVLDITKQVEELLSQLYDTLSASPLTPLQRRGEYSRLAFAHYKKYITARDSIANDEQNKKQMRTEVNYEFEKKEFIAKAEQDKKDAITAEEKQRQKVITYSISVGLFLVLLLAIFIFKGYRQKQKANIIITEQKSEVEKQKHIIEEKNKDITDSINYAKRIQQAKLPKKEEIYSAFSDSFVLFKPKDIVSGDFYFFHKATAPSNSPQGGELGRVIPPSGGGGAFIAAADCTGHGVPGAFMSMIGSEKLDDAVSQSSDTSEILKLLNKGIKTSLKQSETDESATRDGMDIALCSVDTNARVVKFAGANRPIWIIRNGQTAVEEIKATKKAIGGFTEDSQHFDTHVIQLQHGDTFYISTDGYADTFGKQDKKLTTKKFKEILLSIQDKTMKEQEQHLDNFIEDWKGGTEQVDDILVIGVRL